MNNANDSHRSTVPDKKMSILETLYKVSLNGVALGYVQRRLSFDHVQ